MHPAKSVIFFTTASGAGYGLLIWLALFSVAGLVPAEASFGLAAFGTALGLITAGLLSSTFHLGHPERAWRAMSQWRSSWLSREGLVAIITYIPAVLFAAAWVGMGVNQGAVGGIGIATAVLCLVTVYCTAMIYGSLKTIHAWHNSWAIGGYLIYALMTGAVLMSAFTHLWQYEAGRHAAGVAVVFLVIGLIVKRQHWQTVTEGRSKSTAGTATGLGEADTISLLEGPHSEANYLMQEMGYKIARKHAEKLRTYTYALAFVLPILLSGLAIALGGQVAVACTVAAVVSGAVGIAVERWLFFAEAKHVVTLYYGEAYA